MLHKVLKTKQANRISTFDDSINIHDARKRPFRDTPPRRLAVNALLIRDARV